MPGQDGKLTMEEYYELFPAARAWLESLTEITPGQQLDQEYQRLKDEMDRRLKVTVEPDRAAEPGKDA